MGTQESGTREVPRDNAAWLVDLSAPGYEQQVALADLRAALLRALRGAFARNPSVDEAFLEDAVQDALLRILDSLHQFEGRSRFLTWATSIAIRVAMREMRRKRWKDVSLDEMLADGHAEADPGALQGNGGGGETPGEAWARQALIDKVLDIIENDLTERQKAALLAELRGMPQEDIARNLGSNRNAVYKLTHDARKALKRGLESAGYGAADVHAVLSP